MANKVQTQLLVNLLTRQRADALAVVMGEPRAEIWRRAIEGTGLSNLEAESAYALTELQEISGRISPDPSFLEFAERVARDGFTLADLRNMTEYPERAEG
jgi:plasmid replication initiation protein